MIKYYIHIEKDKTNSNVSAIREVEKISNTIFDKNTKLKHNFEALGKDGSIILKPILNKHSGGSRWSSVSS